MAQSIFQVQKVRIKSDIEKYDLRIKNSNNKMNNENY